MSLYPDLLSRLRADAAANVNILLLVRGEKRGPITPNDVIRVTNADGGWYIRVNAPEGTWLASYRAGDVCASEVEALCAFIEGARRDIESMGGEPPGHVLERLEEDARSLAVYRELTKKLVRGVLAGTLDALDELDEVAEADAAGGVQQALERALAYVVATEADEEGAPS